MTSYPEVQLIKPYPENYPEAVKAFLQGIEDNLEQHFPIVLRLRYGHRSIACNQAKTILRCVDRLVRDEFLKVTIKDHSFTPGLTPCFLKLEIGPVSLYELPYES